MTVSDAGMIPAASPYMLRRDAEAASGERTEDRGRDPCTPVPASSRLACYSAGEWARAHGIDGRSLNSCKVGVADAQELLAAATSSGSIGEDARDEVTFEEGPAFASRSWDDDTERGARR